MGGWGSGRNPRKSDRRTTDALLALDVRKLKREGLIASGQEELIVREGVEIPLTWTSSGFGGGEGHFLRPWFVCPGCARRAAILYLLPETDPNSVAVRFLCRLCLGLAYPSQRERPILRSKRRLKKARARLAAPGEVLEAKPKGMHHTTFVRLGRAYLKAKLEHAVLYNERWGKWSEQMREKNESGWP